MLLHIGEWDHARNQWRPMCQVWAVFRIAPAHGNRGRGHCQSCLKVWRWFGGDEGGAL